MTDPTFREAGDTGRTGGWWFECCECGDELYQFAGDGGLHLECGDCGHEWYEGEYVSPAREEQSQ